MRLGKQLARERISNLAKKDEPGTDCNTNSGSDDTRATAQRAKWPKFYCD
jgi:hypothetical protein